MTTVLVVDDSEVDRRLVKGLLEQDDELRVEFCRDGAEAVELLDRRTPELVVTDLMMPKVNGLELVAAIRKNWPLVPVILMTSKGNEEIAVQALQLGAASYVPKRMLAQDLLNTVQHVLAASRPKKSHARLLDCLRRSTYGFELDNDPTLFPPLINHVQETVQRFGLCDDADLTRIGIAIEEALANAVYHGNLEVDSSLLEQDDKLYYAQVAERRRSTPYRDRRVYFDVEVSHEEAKIVVRDEGPGFDPSTLPDPREPANLEKVSGRGVLLMRTFMDELTYNSEGNQVTMTKRHEPLKFEVVSPDDE